MKRSAGFLLAACLTAIVSDAGAHKPSDSYLAIEADGQVLRAQWDIALRDLEFALGLDSDGDGAITWGEVRARQAEIDAYALTRLRLGADGKPCKLAATEHLVDDHSDGAYIVLKLAADCGVQSYRAAEVDYRLFFDLDPTHRGLLRLNDGTGVVTAVLGPDQPRFQAAVGGHSRLMQFLDFAREGTWHIWIGFDHVLFLVSLLLPAVLAWTNGRFDPAGRLRPIFWDVFKVVTSFTVAHSITLSLAALGVIHLPSRLVESAIALSVVLAALNNVWPVIHERRWLVAFAFGLVHGFGFASVLVDLGLPQDALLLALLGFNVGVEGGQLVIVSALVPVAFMLRRTWLYQRVIFVGGSAAIALVAAVWLAERALDLRLFPA